MNDLPPGLLHATENRYKQNAHLFVFSGMSNQLRKSTRGITRLTAIFSEDYHLFYGHLPRLIFHPLERIRTVGKLIFS